MILDDELITETNKKIQIISSGFTKNTYPIEYLEHFDYSIRIFL